MAQVSSCQNFDIKINHVPCVVLNTLRDKKPETLFVWSKIHCLASTADLNIASEIVKPRQLRGGQLAELSPKVDNNRASKYMDLPIFLWMFGYEYGRNFEDTECLDNSMNRIIIMWSLLLNLIRKLHTKYGKMVCVTLKYKQPGWRLCNKEFLMSPLGSIFSSMSTAPSLDLLWF